MEFGLLFRVAEAVADSRLGLSLTFTSSTWIELTRELVALTDGFGITDPFNIV